MKEFRIESAKTKITTLNSKEFFSIWPVLILYKIIPINARDVKTNKIIFNIKYVLKHSSSEYIPSAVFFMWVPEKFKSEKNKKKPNNETANDKYPKSDGEYFLTAKKKTIEFISEEKTLVMKIIKEFRISIDIFKRMT